MSPLGSLMSLPVTILTRYGAESDRVFESFGTRLTHSWTEGWDLVATR